MDGVPDGNVAIQGDGAEVHDGRGGEEHIQVDPNGTELSRERPFVSCMRESWHQLQMCTDVTCIFCCDTCLRAYILPGGQ